MVLLKITIFSIWAQAPGAQPLLDCVAVPSGGFFRQKRRLKQEEVRVSKKIGVFFEMFAIFANVDVNLRCKICKIAI